MNGVSSFLGSFDECISIENPSSLSESYTGQYCAVKPLLPLPATEVAYNYDQQQSSDQQIERLMRFYTAYNVQHYFQTNPVLKFVELMKSNKGRVTNFGICLPSTCNARQLEIALNKCEFHFFSTCMSIIFKLLSSSLSYYRNSIGDTGFFMLDKEQNQQLLASIGWLRSICNVSMIYDMYVVIDQK